MIPILYQTITEGTTPTNYGIGALTDAISCEVTEERNGAYELRLTYPANGLHAGDIAPNTIIKAKPNYTDNPQLFRVYKVGKNINGHFDVNAQHITYDLGGKVISTGSAGSITAACLLLTGSAGAFNITTDKVTAGDFAITEPSSVRSWFGGKQGSLLDVYGSGEWYYDNFNCQLKTARGQDRGVTIRYGKNLTELSQTISIENLCTGIIPYYVDSETGAVTYGAKVPTGLTISPDRDKAVDFSNEVDPESATPIASQLATIAAAYISKNQFTTASDSITLNFVQMRNLSDRVDLCDTVHIYFEALGISTSAKCIATTWDVLEDRYTSTTFGTAKTNITDTIVSQQQELKQTATRSAMSEAIERATEAITGNLGGYIVLHDSDSDGQPDELLIMDTPDISTSVKIWRWNQAGLGYSSTGYAGPYGLAITANGQIVADYITTGTLNANLIRAGVIEDVAHNSLIDLSDGRAILNNLIAKRNFYLKDANGVTRAEIVFNVGQGASFNLLASDGTYRGQYYYDETQGSWFQVADMNGNYVALIDTTNGYGGRIRLRDASGNNRVSAFASQNGGSVYIYDTAGLNVGQFFARNGGHVWLTNSTGGDSVDIFPGTYGGEVKLYSQTTQKRQVDLAAWSWGGGLWLYNANGDEIAVISAESNGGDFYIKSDSGTKAAEIAINSQGGGSLWLKDSGGNNRASLFVGSSGDGSLNLQDSSGTININCSGDTGVVTCVSVNQTSSRKVKENIEPIKDARKILELDAVKFDYKNKSHGTDLRGFIAEDVEKVLPNLVTKETEDTPASLNYIGMIPYLQQVIKEQDERIKALENKINNMGG